MIYGYELIIDLEECKNITKGSLRNFIIELCKSIGMKRFREPQIVYFGSDRFKGYSIFQFITTSSIVGHFTKKEAFINIFSCKEFDKNKTIKFCLDWFKTKKSKNKFLRR